MKKLKCLFIALSFLIPFLAFSQDKATMSLPLQYETGPYFNVKIYSYDCFANGTTLVASVSSDKTQKAVRYSFYWEIDGSPAGRSQVIECVQGNYATLYVTQQPSGKQAKKSISLQSNPDKSKGRR